MRVRHSTGEYPVTVERGAAARLPTLLAERFPAHRAVVISDAVVAQSLPTVLAGVARLTFAAGEAHKTRDTWADLTDRLLELGIDRRTVIVALGGGVSTDLAGFVAATTLRGLPWVAVPTTTLAMLDAAIGGKTGVDTAHGKNLVGAMHQPAAVVIDPLLLETLPDALYVDGLAEAVKHAAIADATHWRWLEAEATDIVSRDPAAVDELLATSVAIKATVVGEDEREHGRRAILNAGHTVAHALEQATGFALRHGEAVAIGLVLETRAAEAMGIAERGSADRIAHLLRQLGLPTVAPADTDRGRFRAALRVDKKNRDGEVRCALIARIGTVAQTEPHAWTIAVSAEQLAEMLG